MLKHFLLFKFKEFAVIATLLLVSMLIGSNLTYGNAFSEVPPGGLGVETKKQSEPKDTTQLNNADEPDTSKDQTRLSDEKKEDEKKEEKAKNCTKTNEPLNPDDAVAVNKYRWELFDEGIIKLADQDICIAKRTCVYDKERPECSADGITETREQEEKEFSIENYLENIEKMGGAQPDTSDYNDNFSNYAETLENNFRDLVNTDTDSGSQPARLQEGSAAPKDYFNISQEGWSEDLAKDMGLSANGFEPPLGIGGAVPGDIGYKETLMKLCGQSFHNADCAGKMKDASDLAAKSPLAAEKNPTAFKEEPKETVKKTATDKVRDAFRRAADLLGNPGGILGNAPNMLGQMLNKLMGGGGQNNGGGQGANNANQKQNQQRQDATQKRQELNNLIQQQQKQLQDFLKENPDDPERLEKLLRQQKSQLEQFKAKNPNLDPITKNQLEQQLKVLDEQLKQVAELKKTTADQTEKTKKMIDDYYKKTQNLKENPTSTAATSLLEASSNLTVAALKSHHTLTDEHRFTGSLSRELAEGIDQSRFTNSRSYFGNDLTHELLLDLDCDGTTDATKEFATPFYSIKPRTGGADVLISQYLSVPRPGAHCFAFKVDTTNKLQETNETDNQSAWRSFKATASSTATSTLPSLNFEVSVYTKNYGAQTQDWTSSDVVISEGQEIAFRWDAPEYRECRPLLSAITEGIMDNPSPVMRNTLEEKYDLHEHIGYYEVRCSAGDVTRIENIHVKVVAE